jgi:hypothetical protein
MDIPQSWADIVLLHYPTSFADILPPEHLANPISLGLHAIHYLLLAPLLATTNEPDRVLRRGPAKTGVGNRWDKWEEEGRVSGRGLGGGWSVRDVEISRLNCLDFHHNDSLSGISLCELDIPLHSL